MLPIISTPRHTYHTQNHTTTHNHTQPNTNVWVKQLYFVFVCLCQVIVYEGGAVPAVPRLQGDHRQDRQGRGVQVSLYNNRGPPYNEPCKVEIIGNIMNKYYTEVKPRVTVQEYVLTFSKIVFKNLNIKIFYSIITVLATLKN